MSDDPKFQVGDLVTRDGSDVQRVTEVDNDYFCLTVECIRAPNGGWCKVGDVEHNLSRRYDFAGDVVDASAVRIAGTITKKPGDN
jgi:hypothetical protein